MSKKTKEGLKATTLTIFNPDTGELIPSEVVANFKSPKVYGSYFMGAKTEMSIFDFQLTETEQKIFRLLFKNMTYKNITFYNQDIFSKTLKIHPVTIRKSLSNLKKMNIIFHIKKNKSFTSLRFNPHLFWYGKPADFFEISDKYPKPIPVNKHDTDTDALIDDWLKETKKIYVNSMRLPVPKICKSMQVVN